MSKFSNRLLILALLSAFAATDSAVAAEKHRAKNKQEQATEKQREQPRGEQQKRSVEEDHDEHQLAYNSDRSMTVKTGVVKVTNRGGGPLTITAAPALTRLSGNGSFAIVPPATGTACAASLVVAPRGGECTIGVQYTPSDRGVSTARLTLTDIGAETTTHETIIKAE